MTIRCAACFCGQLHLAVNGEQSRIWMCHCLECQLRTGAVISNQARFRREQITFVWAPSETRLGLGCVKAQVISLQACDGPPGVKFPTKLTESLRDSERGKCAKCCRASDHIEMSVFSASGLTDLALVRYPTTLRIDLVIPLRRVMLW